MVEIENLILGGGISGLGVGLYYWEKDKEYLIIEKENYYGGALCQF